MDRHPVALTLALVAALAFGGLAHGRPRRRSHRNHTGGEARAAAPRKKSGETASLHVRSIDLLRRRVLIEVSGLNKTPPSNFFTFTDDRDHHYIAINSFCDPPFASGTQVCELEIPAGYERHKMVSLILHLGALHGSPLEVQAPEVADAWAAATLYAPGIAVAAAKTAPAAARSATSAANSATPAAKDAKTAAPAAETAPSGADTPADDDDAAGSLDSSRSAPDPRN